MKSGSRDLAILAMLLCAGITIQAVESLYLPPLMIPGAKLGLANIITLLVIAYFTSKDVLIHVVLRVSVVSLITGTFISTTFFYGLAGGLVSALAMIVWYRLFFGSLSFVGVSLIGALTHNLTQLALSVIILGHMGVITLLPWLIFIAVVTGVPNGYMVNILKDRLSGINRYPQHA